MNDNFMKRAIELSKEKMQSNCGGPFGAVITKKDQIISEGWNQVTSTNDPTAHAEIIAIKKACKKLKKYELTDCEMYTSCEPCPMCLGAIYWCRLKKVYYANTKKDATEINFDDDFIYSEIKKIPAKRKIPMMHSKKHNLEAKKVFNEWINKKNKVLY